LDIATALEFSQSQKMHIAFLKLTNKFLKEFKNSTDISVNEVIGWCEYYCGLCGASLTLAVSSMDELFQLIQKKLPHHNFLNPELLQLLADLSEIDCLVESVRNYETTFSSLKLSELTLSMGANIKEIQVTKMDKNFSELVTKLQKKDLTVGQLRGLTAELDEKILYLRTGVTPPQWVEEGCVCIKWLIPSCLVDYAYHSACLNVDLFSEMKLIHLTIGRYTVEQKEGYSGSMSHFIMFSIQVSVVI